MHTVAMCVDANYLLPSMVTLASLADAVPRADRAASPVRILTTNLTTAQSTTMAAFVQRLGFGSFDIAWERPSADHRIIYGSYISTTTYLRFNFSPTFAKHPYLVYVDADVLVLGDIFAPLNRLGEGQVGLVRDPVNHTVGDGPALPGVADRWPELRGRQYFNAGMFWTTTTALPRLRRQVDKIMTVDGPHIHFNDQDALNLWALRNDGAVRPVDTAYNTFELDRFREEDDWIRRVARQAPPQTSPAVLHFAGPPKPWHKSCPPTEGTRVYRRYLCDVTRHLHCLGDLSITVPPDPEEVRRARRRDARVRRRDAPAWCRDVRKRQALRPYQR
jgi:lipopolysaccharide biosynthesis glycosyltransferase